MQIHELNNYNGNLDSSAYLAVDNGSDTGKVSTAELLADTNSAVSQLDTVLNGRIDNIVAGGEAPSASEIVDARYGADGVTYPSLGAAIRDQVTDLKSDLVDLENDLYNKTDNLFDYHNSTFNKIPNLADGSAYNDFVEYGNWITTNYIGVESGKQYCVIKDGRIPNILLTVAYYKNGILASKDRQASNPFTVPSDVDHIYICYRPSDYFTEYSTSIKEYSSDMDYDWRKYGNIANFVHRNTINESGLYVDGNNYYHFVKFGKKYIIRKFKREGSNNLFQFSALYEGLVDENGVSISKTISENGTDIIGPISVMRQDIDSGGKWAGGYHHVDVNGVNCPTAKQESLSIKINGEEVSSNGLYYGVVNIVATNLIYFPNTVTGLDLTNATQCIKETRHYILDTKMNVQVTLDFVEDTRVVLYYGLQAVRIGFDSILLPNDEKRITFSEMLSDYWIENQNKKVIMEGSGLVYEITLSDAGLGSFNHNTGTSSYKYGSLPKDTRKYYQVLISGSYDQTFIKSGTSLYWEGIYNIYPN